MPAPLVQQLFSIDTPYARREREIDIHYDISLMAKSATEVVDCQKQLIRIQSEAAVSNIRAMKELHSRQEETNALLDAMQQGIGRLQETSLEIIDQIMYQTDVLDRGFQTIAEELMRNQRTLEQIALTLSQPYEIQVQELLRNAEDALQEGMADSGKDREANFADALRLLEKVLADVIGQRNYVAWFQMGWLKWRHLNKIEEAEEAFANAVRLSKSRADAYHLDSLRHLAYIQYLSGKMQEAWATIQKATDLAPNDHDTLYDAARYASQVGLCDKAAELLNRCIDLRPQTIMVMFSEKDFYQCQPSAG
jgi:tetratricopeptide (TPR) repeat protein